MPFRHRSGPLLQLLSLALTVLMPASALAEGPRTLAILGFHGSHVPQDTLTMLSNAARTGAFRSTERGRLIVLSRETIAEVVEEAALEHFTGDDAIETGQDLGADYVVLGEVSVVDGSLVSTINLYETEWESRLGVEIVRAQDQLSLMDQVEERVAAMLAEAPGMTEDGRDNASRNLTSDANQHRDRRRVEIKHNVIGNWFFQSKQDGAITENDFIRRFAETTGRSDANRFEENRSSHRVVIGFVFTALGVGSMAFGFAQPEFDSCLTCPSGLTPNPAHVWPIVGGATLTGVGLWTTIANLLNPDGIPTDHSMSIDEAERLIDLHNDALGTQGNGSSAAPEGSPLAGPNKGEPRAENTARLWSFVAGPGGIGVAGSF